MFQQSHVHHNFTCGNAKYKFQRETCENSKETTCEYFVSQVLDLPPWMCNCVASQPTQRISHLCLNLLFASVNNMACIFTLVASSKISIE